MREKQSEKDVDDGNENVKTRHVLLLPLKKRNSRLTLKTPIPQNGQTLKQFVGFC